MTELFPDLVSKDVNEISTWLLRLTSGRSDVINNRCVLREHDGKFSIQGWKKAASWNIAAARLAKLGATALIVLLVLASTAEARGGGHAYGSHSGSHGGGSHRGHR